MIDPIGMEQPTTRSVRRGTRWIAAATVAAVAAVGAAGARAAVAPLACSPHAGLGSVALVRGGRVHVVDLASCRDRVLSMKAPHGVMFTPAGGLLALRPSSGLAGPGGRLATVRATGKGAALRDTIRVTSPGGSAHSAYSESVSGATRGIDSPGPIELLGWSGDARWIFFAIDPGSSASIAADGLLLQVVAAAGGTPHRLGVMLAYRDYLASCGGRLIFSAGRDRIAIHDKRLLVAAPPSWRPRPLVSAPGRSFGSLACDPTGHAVVAQSQESSIDAGFFATHWSLWEIRPDGTRGRLTSPPAGYADESPRFSADGKTLLFVRSHTGAGKLYAFQNGRVVGPLLSLGSSLGYYGHRDWWQAMAWSLSPGG